MASWHPTTILYGRRPGDTFEQNGWQHHHDIGSRPQPRRSTLRHLAIVMIVATILVGLLLIGSWS